MRTVRTVALAFAFAALAGCNTFTCSQTDSFIDDQGNVLHVEYGELKKPYTYTMTSPSNGKTIDGTSTRLVRIELPAPSREWIEARTCQCPFRYGTMYETVDRKWRYFTTGLESAVYLLAEDGKDYYLVFKGTAFQDERSGSGSTK